MQRLFAALAAVALAVFATGCSSPSNTPHAALDRKPPSTETTEAEIRVALSDLGKALESPGPAWVHHYTGDAMFVGPHGPAVQGRAALRELAQRMRPLAGIKITPLRIEGNANLAYAYVRASWIGAEPSQISRVRSLLVLRKEADGKWRVAQELLHEDPEAQ